MRHANDIDLGGPSIPNMVRYGTPMQAQGETDVGPSGRNVAMRLLTAGSKGATATFDRGEARNYQALVDLKTEVTFICFYRLTSHADNLDSIACLKKDTGTGGAINNSFALLSNSTPFSQRWIVSDGTSSFIATGSNIVVGEDRLDIGTGKKNGRIILYKNGAIEDDIVGPTADFNTDATITHRIGDFNGGAAAGNKQHTPGMICYYTAILKRQINAGQVRQLSRDPYGPFRRVPALVGLAPVVAATNRLLLLNPPGLDGGLGGGLSL